VTLDEARKACGFADSFARVDRMVEAFVALPRREGFVLLGEQWSDCDRIGRWRSVLRDILRSASREELDLMMTGAERTALAKLPA